MVFSRLSADNGLWWYKPDVKIPCHSELRRAAANIKSRSRIYLLDENLNKILEHKELEAEMSNAAEWERSKTSPREAGENSVVLISGEYHYFRADYIYFSTSRDATGLQKLDIVEQIGSHDQSQEHVCWYGWMTRRLD